MKHTGPSFGRDIYPTRTAYRGSPRIGITPLRRCQQCGLPNDTRRTASGKRGEGLSEISGSSPTEWEVTSGCGFCGSLMWTVMTNKLPDDRFLPTPEIKRRR